MRTYPKEHYCHRKAGRHLACEELHNGERDAPVVVHLDETQQVVAQHLQQLTHAVHESRTCAVRLTM